MRVTNIPETWIKISLRWGTTGKQVSSLLLSKMGAAVILDYFPYKSTAENNSKDRAHLVQMLAL